MKNLLIVLLTFCTIGLSYSQEGKRKEKIRALKTAHITSKLNLTAKEAEKFWPIYNEIQKKEDLIRRKTRRLQQTISPKLTETEAKQILDELVQLSNRTHAVKTKFMHDIQEILPAKKIIKLRMAEDQFKRELLQQFRNRNRPH